jgi:hypothetical protein
MPIRASFAVQKACLRTPGDLSTGREHVVEGAGVEPVTSDERWSLPRAIGS